MRAFLAGSGRHLRTHIEAELRSYAHDVTVADESFAAADTPPEFAADTIAVMSGSETCGVLDADASAGDDLAVEFELLRRLILSRPAALVVLSSAAVYALSADQLDEDSALEPGTQLGCHALALEQEARALAVEAGVPLTIVRTSIIAGAASDIPAGARTPKSARLLPGLEVTGLAYPVMTTGYTAPSDDITRLADFVNAADVASAVRLAAEKLSTGCDIPEVLNVSSGVATSPATSLKLLSAIPNIELEPYAATAPAERLVSVSSRLAEHSLGWRPATPSAVTVESEFLLLRQRAFAPYRMTNKKLKVLNEYVVSTLGREFFSLWGIIAARDRNGIFDSKDLRFDVGGTSLAAQFYPRNGFRIPGSRGRRVMPYRLRIPRSDIEVMPAQIAVRLVYTGPESRWFDRRLGYAELSNLSFSRHSRLFPLHDGASRLFVRQSSSDGLFLTLREKNYTDTFRSRIKVLAARLSALVRRKNAVLLYEKESSRYEESASVIFEALIDGGHDDVYFILDRGMFDRVPERYRSKLVARFSFRHFYYFFSARTLIGTELVAHAIDLRTTDRLLRQHLQSARFGFVFLQHGVMYMVALSSKQRSFFRAGVGFPKDTRIVCSSEREKRHFVELGGFAPDNMYVCGLPKFDNAVLDSAADRILIMPTWRPWEYNKIRTNPNGSGYFAMLMQMYDAVPEHLKERVWILPHPLVLESLRLTPLGPRIWDGESYDAALRCGTVLVTDYSSIAYDAFYRGANVVFWWKDKDDCMRQYGGHLMLDDRTAFGPVCYDAAALSDAIGSAYTRPQDPEHVLRYEQIVEFRDGRNTQRLIEMMERDHLV